MNRIIAWLAATMVLIILLTSYQVRVAGAGGGEEQRPAASTVQDAGSSGAPTPEDSHPPK
jgi:hypothetical protein